MLRSIYWFLKTKYPFMMVFPSISDVG